MEKEHIITIFSENKIGILNQITTVFIYRSVNIESITVSESAIQGIHKYTIVINTSSDTAKQLAKLIEKKIDVLKVFVFSNEETIQQEIALYKVCRGINVEQLVREQHIRILEITEDYIVIEKTGHKSETQALFELLKPLGLQQFVRSGLIAIIKSKRELLQEYLDELEKLQ